MRLPTWDEVANRPSPAGRVQLPRYEGSNPVAEGLAQVSDVATNIMGLLEKRDAEAKRQREKADAVEAAKVFSQAQLDWQGKLLTAQQGADVGAPDFTKGVLEGFDADAKTRLENVPESARPWFETRMADLRGTIGQNSMVFEAKSRLGKQLDDLNSTVDLQANGVRTDFSRLRDALGVTEGAIEASSLAPAAKQQQREIARTGIVNAAFQGLNERDPAQAKKLLESGQFDGLLKPEDKNALVNNNFVELNRRQAEAEQRRRLAEQEQRVAAAEVRQEAAFALQSMQGGTVYAGFDQLVAKAKQLDPKTAVTLERAKSDLGWTSNLLKMPPADILHEIEETRRQAGATDNAEVSAALTARASTGEKVLQQVVKGVKQDPLSWAEGTGVVQTSPVDFAKPESIQARQQAVMRAKATYGVDVPFLKPDEADSLVKAFDSAGTSDQKFATIAGLLSLPDDQAGQTLAQLEAAKLPPAARRVLDMVRDDPSSVPTARKLLGELTAPAAKANLTDADLTSIKKNARSVYSEGVGTVYAKQYALTGDAGYEQRIEEDAADLEHVVKARSGAGRDDADQSAYGDLFGHLEPVSVDDFAQVVVPKGTDVDKLELGLAQLRRVDVPKLLAGDRPKDQAAARQWETYHLAPLVERGTWINAGSGFVLIEPGTGKPVADSDGQPKIWSLDDVLQAAKEPGALDKQVEDSRSEAQDLIDRRFP